METPQNNDERLTRLARKMGSENASTLLSALGKDRTFLKALDTDLGAELLKDAVKEIERTIELILQEKDDPTVRAELKAYRTILSRWSAIIKRYNHDQKRFIKATQP